MSSANVMLNEKLASPEVFAAALAYLPHGVSQFDKDGRLVLSNQPFKSMYNLSDKAVAADTTFDSLLGEIAEPSARSAFEIAAHSQAGFGSGSYVWEQECGRTIALSCESIPGGGFVVLHEDVTRLQAESRRISELANQDSLTGLFNRPHLSECLREQFENMSGGAEFALLYVDLDHFKPINDTFGHPTGDHVLREVADRLRAAIGPGDVIARLGGDEFAILQTGQQQPKAANELSRRIIDALASSVNFETQPINVGASVGVAIAPYDADNDTELLQSADLALYCAKADGRGVHRFFEPEMAARMLARRSLELEFRRAIELEQFEMHYQPVMDMQTKRVVGLEGLVRWVHPELGLIAPDRFIPMAEETGLIVPLGDWVLRRACLDAALWDSSLTLSVNLSPVQLRNRSLVMSVMNALSAANMPPQRLELEITETVLLSNNGLALALLKQLREQGVRIAMDDFGTGYSSISYLRQFPFDRIKIDRSFVSGANADAESSALVRMIAALGQTLGVRTTAEGVETQLEMQSVREAGVTEMQGYLLSRPIPASQVPLFLNDLSQMQPAAEGQSTVVKES